MGRVVAVWRGDAPECGRAVEITSSKNSQTEPTITGQKRSQKRIKASYCCINESMQLVTRYVSLKVYLRIVTDEPSAVVSDDRRVMPARHVASVVINNST